jgi:glycosyltransferase involved in cell wall biosynthesis
MFSRRVFEIIDEANVDLVCLQFEYGIFGGKAGSHILTLLRDLRMPIVTTLHTILNLPTPDQRLVLEEVAALSDRLIVMSERGSEYLQTIYGVLPEKIDLIPHGIPDVPFVDPSFNKDLFGVEGKTVLLSFGLLSANKGIETVISALPDIVARYPDIVYIIVGATHPHVLNGEGETHRFLSTVGPTEGVESCSLCQFVFYPKNFA